MNNIIIIRGDTLAISDNPGDFGGFHSGSYLAVDPDELMTPLGMFFPCGDQSLDILPVLKLGRNKTLVDDSISSNPHLGIKGVLAAPEDGTVAFYSVRVATRNGDWRLIFTALPTGQFGYATVSTFEQLNVQAITCIRLTDTIEDTVTMYCRHLTGNPEYVSLYTRESIYKLIRRYYKQKGFLDEKPPQEDDTIPEVAEG